VASGRWVDKRNRGKIEMKRKCGAKHSNSIALKDSRALTLNQKKKLKYGDEVYLEGNCGHFLRARVNGKTKTWKRTPEKVKVPFKYGLYQHGYIDEQSKVRKAK